MSVAEKVHVGSDYYEANLIGSLFQAVRKIPLIATKLAGHHFLDPELGQLFTLMVDMEKAGHSVLDAKLLLEKAESIFPGTAMLEIERLATREAHGYHADYYADKVLEFWKARQLKSIGSELYNSDPALDIMDAINQGKARLEALEATHDLQIKSVFETEVELFNDALADRDKSFCYSGFADIDSDFGGVGSGELCILAARPGNGKTAFALQIAMHNAKRNRHVLFVSLEMTRQELAGRLISSESTITIDQIRHSSFDKEMFVEVSDEHKLLPFTIYDPHEATIEKIGAAIRLMRYQQRCEMAIIDYIGLVKPRDRRKPRYEQVTEISFAMKQLAKQLEIPVIAVCQLNREAEGKLPMLKHLRESGSIEQDADQIYFLHRLKRNKNDFEFIVAKNRHGKTGVVALEFDGEHTRFYR